MSLRSNMECNPTAAAVIDTPCRLTCPKTCTSAVPGQVVKRVARGSLRPWSPRKSKPCSTCLDLDQSSLRATCRCKNSIGRSRVPRRKRHYYRTELLVVMFKLELGKCESHFPLSHKMCFWSWLYGALRWRLPSKVAGSESRDSNPGCWLRAHFLTSPEAPDDSWALEKWGVFKGP